MNQIDINGDVAVAHKKFGGTVQLADGSTDTLKVLEQGEVTCTGYPGCSAGSEVRLCTVLGGGHTWPGGDPQIAAATEALAAEGAGSGASRLVVGGRRVHNDLEAELARRESELLTALKTRETELAQHQADLESELTSRQQAHAAKQIELEARLEQEMATRRDAYVKQLDAKLSDSVIAFLSEALGQQVDLGAQTTYLTSVLEQHKDELKQGIEG